MSARPPPMAPMWTFSSSAPGSRASTSSTRARGRLLRRPGRGRRRRGRDLVLEPLPRSSVRLRELHLRLSVLPGAVRRVGVAGALRRAARDRALPQPRRRPVRPPSPHAVRRQGHIGHVRRGHGDVDRHDRRRCGHSREVPRGRDRRAVGAPLPGRTGARGVRRRVAPHGSVARESPRLRGQTRRCRRHWFERRADRPGRRAGGRVADRLPAHRQLVHSAEQRADHPRRTGAAPGGVRGDLRDGEHVTARVPPPAARPGDLRRLRGRPPGLLRERCGTAPASPSSPATTPTCCSTPRPTPSGAASSPRRSPASCTIRKRPGS